MRDYKGMKRQRGRNRSGGGGQQGGGKPGQNANRAFDSNGPENIKVRGHAQHVYEKYQQLGRDATSAGDRVLAENYLQHAEHYFRTLRVLQPNRAVTEIVGRDSFVSGFDLDFEDEAVESAMEEADAAAAQSGNATPESDAERQEPRAQTDRGERSQAERNQGDRSQGDRSQGDRNQGERSDRQPREFRERNDRDRQDRDRQGERPRFEPRRNWEDRGDRPQGDRNQADRSQGERSQDRPFNERAQGERSQNERASERPQGERTGGERFERPRYEGRREREDRGERVDAADPGVHLRACALVEADALTHAAQRGRRRERGPRLPFRIAGRSRRQDARPGDRTSQRGAAPAPRTSTPSPRRRRTGRAFRADRRGLTQSRPSTHWDCRRADRRTPGRRLAFSHGATPVLPRPQGRSAYWARTAPRVAARR